MDTCDGSDQSLTIDLLDAFKKKKAQSGDHKDKLEMLAMHRDMKRRPQSYRAKSVHTTGKSYSEILRNIIENQCESLKCRLETKSDTSNTSLSHKHKHKTHKRKSKHKSEYKSHHSHKHKRHKH